MPKVSAHGVNLVKQFEGCSLTAYQDCVNIWTIGYGHTPAHSGMVITQEIAETVLIVDLSVAADYVHRYVEVSLTQNQFDALCSLVFNVGPKCLMGTHLITHINAKRINDAANDFLNWDHAGGRQVEGLTKRRKAERNLFLS